MYVFDVSCTELTKCRSSFERWREVVTQRSTSLQELRCTPKTDNPIESSEDQTTAAKATVAQEPELGCRLRTVLRLLDHVKLPFHHLTESCFPSSVEQHGE